MTWYSPKKTSEIPSACKRRMNNIERVELEHQLYRLCTPPAEQMPPRYADDDLPDITYNQNHGLME